MSDVFVVIGTRPELIKVAPIILKFREKKINFKIVNTAQHKDLLKPYWAVFGIKPDFELDVMESNQHLSMLTSKIFAQFQELLNLQKKKPKIILAQGDTTTVMVASMVAFYNKIAFGHIEAGLRSFDFENPFPEEYNRKVSAINAKFHFAPTKKSKENLLQERIPKKNILVTGNTVVDSLNFIKKSKSFAKHKFSDENLNKLVEKEFVFITCHRRENHGEGIKRIASAINKLAIKYQKLNFIWIMHPNPNVKQSLLKSELSKRANCYFSEPVDYIDLLKLIENSKCIITDSGGIQEEAPSFNKTVLVLRKTTERPESVDLGISRLCGNNENEILKGFDWAISTKLKKTKNPYGSGNAAEKIVASVSNFLKS